MTLGQRIQELRKAMGLSQEALGEALGVSRQAVSKWEGDNGIPELDKLIAMSRLFGVTVGELLGVEAPAQPAEVPPEREEERRLEAILQEYTRQSEQKNRERRRWIPVAALAAALAVGLLVNEIVSLRTTVRHLRSEMSSLQVQVSNSLGSLSSQIHNSVVDILAEQNDPVRKFDWQAEAFDPEKSTVTLRLTASMKEYLAGSQVQFLADWTTVDEQTGLTTGDWVDGPDFSDSMTIPMNNHTEISIRVRDAEGNIKEQFVDTLYAFHPESFQLEGHNLTAVLAITGRYDGVSHVTVKAEEPHVDLYSRYPSLYQPKSARMTVTINGETVLEEAMAVSREHDDDGSFPATIQGGYLDLTLKEGDQVQVTLQVTDSLDREQTFTEDGVMEKGYLTREAMTAPVVWE